MLEIDEKRLIKDRLYVLFIGKFLNILSISINQTHKYINKDS